LKKLLECSFSCETDLPPHVRDNNDVLQGCVTAKLAERLEVASRDPRKSLVGNAAHVNNPSELRASRIPDQGLNRPGEQQVDGVTHVVSKSAAINFKTSVSLLLVSSNPGTGVYQ
jgi:hypothetical protein